jgi:hypothetical protein
VCVTRENDLRVDAIQKSLDTTNDNDHHVGPYEPDENFRRACWNFAGNHPGRSCGVGRRTYAFELLGKPPMVAGMEAPCDMFVFHDIQHTPAVLWGAGKTRMPQR